MRDSPNPTDEVIVCADGFPLTARQFRPAADARGSVLVAPATGVKATYYWRYAAFLAAAGFHAVVVDYRGVGRSLPPGSPRTLRGFQARWHHWGTLDLDAVIGWTHARRPDVPIMVVGHSFGGLAACLAPRAALLSRVLMVGTQHAHWRDYAAEERLRFFWRWHLAMPALTAALGYFPGKRLGWLENLPRGVAFDWARGRADFADTLGPQERAALDRCADLDLDVLAVSTTDDPYATPAAVDRTLRYLRAARVERVRLAPADLQVTEIGHFGLFHDRFRTTFWPETARWLSGEPTWLTAHKAS